MTDTEPRIDPESDLVVMIVTDGTDVGDEAIAKIGRIIPAAARWEVATIIDDAPDLRSGATGFASPVLSPEEVEEIEAAQQIEGDAATAAAARALGPIPVHSTVVRGSVDDLAAHADDVGADVIVVAADAELMDRVLTTSLAGDLLGRTDKPIMIFPT